MLSRSGLSHQCISGHHVVLATREALGCFNGERQALRRLTRGSSHLPRAALSDYEVTSPDFETEQRQITAFLDVSIWAPEYSDNPH